MLTPPYRWPTPPRSEASCCTTVSDPSHSGGGSGAAAAEPANCLASMEHSSRPVAMDTASPALGHLQQNPHHGGGAVIAGGADEGRQPLPDPLASHPRYRKIRDLNWWAPRLRFLTVYSVVFVSDLGLVPVFVRSQT